MNNSLFGIGFWLSVDNVPSAWINFVNGNRSSLSFLDLPEDFEEVLNNEYNATVRQVNYPDGELPWTTSIAWFIGFKSEEDITYFMMRWS